jgi:hypothetical protein
MLRVNKCNIHGMLLYDAAYVDKYTVRETGSTGLARHVATCLIFTAE